MIATLALYFIFRRDEGGRGRALDAFGVRFVFFFLSASDAFSLSVCECEHCCEQDESPSKILYESHMLSPIFQI
jgi:hypothetical protein